MAASMQIDRRIRDETMNRNGWSVLRFWHADILRDRRPVLETIVAALEGRLSGKMIAVEAKYLPAFGDLETSR
jgi:very-short-patch-repair endonuclease